MRFVLVAAAKDVRRRLADPAALAIWIGIPLLLSGLMQLVAGGDNTVPRATVLVVDQDNTLLSLLLAGGGPFASALDLETVTLEDGRRRIEAGDATALLVVPRGFQDAVLSDGRARLELVTNPSQRVLPAIVEEGLEVVVEGVFYVQQLVGPDLRRILGGGAPSDADIAATSVAINERIRQLQGVLLPPALSLEIETEESAGASLNFGQLFLPGVLFMSFLFVAVGISVDIWEERRLGTLRRALVTPHAAWHFLAGKLAAGVMVMAAIAAVALVAAVAWFDVALARVVPALLWCTFVGGSLLALLLLLQTLAGSERGAHLLSSAVTFPLMMLGGSFFPFDTMPAWMVAIGRWTPNGLGVVRLRELLYGDPSPTLLLVAALGIGLPAVVAFALAARRVRRSFATA